MKFSVTVETLNAISLQFNRYLGLLIFLFGIIGNLINCWVFLQRKLRTNPCVVYFLVASITNIISIVSGVPPRMFRDWNIFPDLTETDPILCRLRLVVVFTTRNISAWLLAFATIDRFLVSSPDAQFRRWSNLKTVCRCIWMISFVSLAFWSESLICFEANLTTTPVKCYAKSDSCRILNDLSQALITTIIPSFFMLVFGLGTIHHIHRSRLVYPTQPTRSLNSNIKRNRKTDTSLTRMLLLQVTLLTIFNMPQAIQKFYITNTFYNVKSSYQKSLENLLFTIALLCTYLPNCLPFYLYTFTGTVFRKTLLELFHKLAQRLRFCR